MSYPESIQPRVSVIVASYNNGRYLGRCLQSLGVQSLQDFEVLVIDDCSTDDSREIYTSFSANDPRFRYHELPENKGITYVRNIAFELAKGKYIAVLDADDIAYPTRL
ncbi:MAG: glycosyltransferase family A protein, partial [Candidatus Cloacimonetes bacterium]|nr:glycosyltransferase family A protein [Candidatus Cloacimonadota bacterium]